MIDASPNFNGGTVAVWEWMNNFTPRFDGRNYLSVLVKGATYVKTLWRYFIYNSQHWDGADRQNHSSWKTGMFVSYMVTAMAAEYLAKGARNQGISNFCIDLFVPE